MAESARGYWSTTRLNGQPLQPGTVCWVTEIDGQNPIATYGATAQDVIEKLSLGQAYAQAELARRSAAVQEPGKTPVVRTIVPARTRLTADQVAQRTSDLGNPAKAGEAVAALVKDATGIDLKKMARERFYALAQKWQHDTPAFNNIAANRTLLGIRAGDLVGGDITMITPEILTRAFEILRSNGEHVDASVAPPDPNPNPASSTIPNPPLPGESPVQRTERQRGTTFATQARSNNFRGGRPSAEPAPPKYTKQELLAMSPARERELDDPKHPDHKAYNDACEFHFGQAAARA